METLYVDKLMQNNTPGINFWTWALLHNYVIKDPEDNTRYKCNVDRIILIGSSYPDPIGEERDWAVIDVLKNGRVPYFYMPPENDTTVQDWKPVFPEDYEEID